jgi:feruloyl-CoA synthase
MSDHLFADPAITADQRPNGSMIIRSDQPLSGYPASVLHAFRAGSDRHPDRILIAEKLDGAWSACTWSHVRIRVDAIAQGLLDRGLAGRPVLILSHNSVAHLLVTLAAYTIGSPVIPASVAHSLQSTDHAKLRHIVDVCEPAAVFAEDARYARALQAIGAGRLLLSATTTEAGLTPIADIETQPTREVTEAAMAIREDTIAKIMFTSGSTGKPKGVINTHGMLSANQQQLQQVWPFLAAEAPTLLDWLPWSHTFGGNHNMNMVLANGGSMWIDAGRPTPDLIGHTVSNLADVAPTIYFNVPAGYAALVPNLENNERAAQRFFSQLRVAFFAAAALPQQLWDRLDALAVQHDSSMRMATGWGMTETAPAATATHFAVARSDSIGVPLPGVELKLVPTTGTRHELLLRGPNVTPGYYRRPDLRDTSFDHEGFLRTGDAVSLVDPADPNKGLVFDGRIAENFKLSTGTFVTVGTVRPRLLSACGGLLQDAVICGEGTEFLSALAWLHADHADRIDEHGLPEDSLREEITAGLNRLAAQGGGSSQRVERVLILTTPPDLDAGEITDKGYVNQRMVRERRAELVDEVTAAVASGRTVCRLAEPTAVAS